MNTHTFRTLFPPRARGRLDKLSDGERLPAIAQKLTQTAGHFRHHTQQHAAHIFEYAVLHAPADERLFRLKANEAITLLDDLARMAKEPGVDLDHYIGDWLTKHVGPHA